MALSFASRVRAFPSRSILAFLLAGVVAAACNDEANVPPVLIDGAGGAQGVPDHPTTSTLAITKSGITGDVTGKTVTVHVPVRAESPNAATGTLAVSLQSLDGTKVVASANVGYQIAGGELATIDASLPLPDDVTKESDWARYLVRVEGATGAEALRVSRSLQEVLTPFAITLDGPSAVRTDKPASYRLRATHPRTHAPLANVPVTLTTQRDQDAPVAHQATTDANGTAIVDLTFADAGSYTVNGQTLRQGVAALATGPVSVAAPSSKVLLTTDKPIYQPGQTVHLRALALADQSNAPRANESTLFEIEDGKGNKIFKKPLTTDAHGIVSVDFVIGRVVNEGTFTARATTATGKVEKTFTVGHYVLPKFKSTIATDKGWYQPGDPVTGTLDADYYFGKPVANGDVLVEATSLDVAETVFQTVQGKTDANGKFAFKIKLPTALVGLPINGGAALVNVRTTVTDGAGQKVVTEKALTVSQAGVDVAVVPEATEFVPGVPNQIDVYASDPLGGPVVGAAVSLAFDGAASSLAGQTDAYGHFAASYVPGPTSYGQVYATVTPKNGAPSQQSFSFGTQQSTGAHVLVRTDKAVYDAGDAVQVSLIAPGASNVYVDWLNEGQIVDMRTVPIGADGTATFTMPVDATLFGSNRIEAYVVDDGGNVARTGRTVFARGSGALSVAMTTDKQRYAPGEEAKVTFSVVDEQKQPAVAALGVQVVDEAVFGLVDAQPGLLRTYFELESDFSTPSYEIHGPSGDLSSLLFGDTSGPDGAAAQQKAQAAFAALGDNAPAGVGANSWTATTNEVALGTKPYFDAVHAALLPSVQAIVNAAVAELAAAKCQPTTYYCDGLQKSYGDALLALVGPRIHPYDFWGNAYRFVGQIYSSQPIAITSSGPDEVVGTSDDATIAWTWQELAIPAFMNGETGTFTPPIGGGDLDDGVGAPGAAEGGGKEAAGGATASPPTTPDDPGAPPRVRKDFPETLYVNPLLITGADGTATVSIPMADSITSWRVSTLANSASGRLGGNVFDIDVFQDFFVDIDFPAQLTRGDSVTFPVAVYNYLSTPQSVTLTVDGGDWYTLLGSSTLTVDLAPNEVRGVSIPIRVEKVGTGSLTVKANGAKAADAVQRLVEVVPDGEPIRGAKSASLGAGEAHESIGFPATAVEGSPAMHLEIYPAYFSSVVSGMDSILRTPNGCFEQTTSTTWPNVLAERYMQATQQITPDVQLKADSLISAGYQRLLTFEHPGGGFSWFGTQDPAPYLSVTAFGLMEFVDMAQVATVDQAMVDRTAAWLAAQQQADGSWQPGQTESFSFNSSLIRNTAFVSWSLANGGYAPGQVANGLGYVKAHLNDDPANAYTLALALNAFATGAPTDPILSDLETQVESIKVQDGDLVHWSMAGDQTNFYGSGDDADVTATATIAYALLNLGGHTATVDGALAYLAKSRDADGNFGSTQATIWSLRALILAATKGTDAAVGTLDVTVDGAPFSTVTITADQSDVMRTVDLGTLATIGDHDVKLSFVGSGQLSYNLVSTYNVPWGQGGAPDGPLAVSVAYDRTSLAVDETVRATVDIVNLTADTENMVMVTVGIPPGFDLVTDQLDQAVANGQISRYESTERQLDLYVTKLDPNATLELGYQLSATMPVTAQDGGAKAYLYYEPKRTSSAQATTFTVTE